MGNESSLIPEIRKRAIKGKPGNPINQNPPKTAKNSKVKNKQVATRMKDTGRC